MLASSQAALHCGFTQAKVRSYAFQIRHGDKVKYAKSQKIAMATVFHYLEAVRQIRCVDYEVDTILWPRTIPR